ncbi:MAG: hypothetical protein PHY28_03455 [Dehalococcoidales bacterium]|nr:hypothetical protein [Dehalococcoidales bacterium]
MTENKENNHFSVTSGTGRKTAQSENLRLTAKLKGAFLSGIGKGWRSFLWVAKITIPISLLVALLQWSGWLYKVDFLLNPVMKLIHLPSEAALPILSGLLIDNYGTIAVLTVVPLSIEQMTLIAIFSLIAHNFIREGIIQHQSGFNVFVICTVRLIAAIITVLVVSLFMGDTTRSIGSVASIPSQTVSLLEALKNWSIDAGLLLLKILGIVMLIMITLEILVRLTWDKYLFRIFRPLMKVLGLTDKLAMLWVPSAIFGLMYCGPIVVEKSKEGALTRSEVERIHLSMAINHSMVEDPPLYMALGMNGFWLWIPRLIMAIVVVQFYRLIELLKGRFNLRKIRA